MAPILIMTIIIKPVGEDRGTSAPLESTRKLTRMRLPVAAFGTAAILPIQPILLMLAACVVVFAVATAVITSGLLVVTDGHVGYIGQTAYIGSVAIPVTATGLSRRDTRTLASAVTDGRDGCAVWNVASPPDVGSSSNVLKDVEVLSNNNAWAVGTYVTSGPVTQAAIYSWDGSSWSLVPSPQRFWSELNSIVALSPSDIWAVGSWANGSIWETLVEHWDGSTWSVVSSPNVPGAGHHYLYGVAAIAPSDIWAVGYSQATNSSRSTLTLHWNGTQWSILPSPTAIVDTILYSVSASGPNDVWAVGALGSDDFTVAMHWDGVQWSVVQSNNPDYNSRLRDVVALAPDDAWAVGTYHTRGVDWPLVIHWDGVSWTQWPGLDGLEYGEAQLEGIAAAAPNDAWAVGVQVTTTLTLHWDGNTWQRVSSPNSGSAENRPMAVDVVLGGDAWAVGQYTNDISLFRNLGLRLANSCGPPPTPTPAPTCTTVGRWQEIVSANAYVPENDPQAVSGLDPYDVWSVGYHVDNYGRTSPTAYFWDGTDWFTMAVPSQPSDAAFYGVEAVDFDDVYAVGYRNYNNMDTNLIMFANEDVWDVVQSPSPGYTPNYLYGISSRSSGDFWAVGSYYNVSASTDQTMIMHKDDMQWSIVPSPNVGGGRNILRDVTVLAPDDAWAVGYYYAVTGTQEQTLTMHWNGSNWSVIASPNALSGSSYLYSVSSNFDGQVWAAGYSVDQSSGTTGTLIMRWDSTSNQWEITPSPNPGTAGNLLKGISVSRGGGTEAWAVGGFSDSGSVTQTMALRWDGAQWSQVESPNPGQPTNQFADVLTFSRYEAWAVGNRGQSGAYSTLMERYRNNNPCGGCAMQFSDVSNGSTFYQYVHCLACRNIISGYGDGTFRPNASVTRGQLAKIVSNAAGFAESHSEQSFQDVPVGSTFYLFIERLASRAIISGYACGGEGEPCIAPMNRPYFRPGANVTRGQSSKIVALVAVLPDPPFGTQTFEDVPPTHTFYSWIERMAIEGIISGYLCGGVGEPCVPPLNRPYYRSNASITRGQSSKIVSNTFFPGCQALDR